MPRLIPLLSLIVIVVVSASAGAREPLFRSRTMIRERSTSTAEPLVNPFVSMVEDVAQSSPLPFLPSPVFSVDEPTPTPALVSPHEVPMIDEPPTELLSPPPVEPPVPHFDGPIAGEIISPPPVYLGGQTPLIEVYGRVRIKDARKISDGSMPILVTAPDPRQRGCEVCVEICVPPCLYDDIHCRKAGRRLIYTFGRHRVEVFARGQFVVVDYDR